MDFFIKHKIVETPDGTTILLYIDPNLTEFAQELGLNEQKINNKTLEVEVRNYIRCKLKPNLHAKIAKVMFGSLLIASIPLTEQAESTYAANISSNNQSKQQSAGVKVILDGNVLSFPREPVIRNGSTFIPIRSVSEAYGAIVWWNEDSKSVGIEKDDIQIAFAVGSSVARVNGEQMSIPPSINIDGTVMVPLRFISTALGLKVDWDNATRTVTINSPLNETTHKVTAGDTLWGLAQKYGVTVNDLKQINHLTSDTLNVGQDLKIPGMSSMETSNTNQGTDSVSTITYTVQPGDNIWDLGVKYGAPMYELLKVNNMTMTSPLFEGQNILIPVHHVPRQKTVSPNHGEYLDWWTEAQYVFSIGKVAKVTDMQTGKSFMIKRTTGANHADNEPLTANDAAIIKQVWGGTYSWKTRPVIVEVDGRKLAGSMSSMPHDVEYIKAENNFNGHFDIHFKNSTRHKDGLVDHDHQAKIKIAAGLASL